MTRIPVFLLTVILAATTATGVSPTWNVADRKQLFIDNRFIAGFWLEECARLFHNDVAAKVSWRRRADLSSLAEQTIRLKIAMKAAKLYAFQFRRTAR